MSAQTGSQNGSGMLASSSSNSAWGWTTPQRCATRETSSPADRAGHGDRGRIVEAVVYGSDALPMEVLTTCADCSRLNELNRLLVGDLSYVAKKYNLVVFDSDEEDWLAEPFPDT